MNLNNMPGSNINSEDFEDFLARVNEVNKQVSNTHPNLFLLTIPLIYR